jgi:hypothetical protein
MNRLLLITSAVALLATPALAQNETDAAAPAIGQGVTEPIDAVVLDADETQMDVDGDGDLEILKNGYTDAHPWVDKAAFVEGELFGEIERVHYAGDEIDTVVIETGGVAEIGGREVEVPLEKAVHVTNDDGSESFLIALTTAELDALPDFDESLASDYPLSDGLEEGDGVADPAPSEDAGGYDDGAR